MLTSGQFPMCVFGTIWCGYLGQFSVDILDNFQCLFRSM